MKIAVKNFLTTLKRHKAASLLNVLGLSLAFTVFYIIASQVWYSVSYNHSLRDASRTYLVSPQWDGEEHSANSPSPITFEAASKYPGTEVCAGLMSYPSYNKVWVKAGEYNFEKFDIAIHTGNAEVVKLFGFEAVAGDLQKVEEPNTVVVSQSTARLMGIEVGDEIWVKANVFLTEEKPEVPHTVVAIYKDFAKNTFLNHVKIFKNDNLHLAKENHNWNYMHMVRLSEDSDPADFARLWEEEYYKVNKKEMEEYLAANPQEEDFAADIEAEIRKKVHLIPLDEIYFYGNFESTGWFETGSKSAPVILSAIALAIILIAFINFVNFFCALIPTRVQSVNICKVFGASQGTLRWNFLFEAIGIVIISMLVALYLILVLKDSFITDYVTCSLSLADNIPIICTMVVLMVILAIVSAIYPAFYITKANTSMAVKSGFANSAGGRRLRTILVSIQFGIAMILIIVTAVFYAQYRYMTKFDVGFDRENIVTFPSVEASAKRETVIEKLLQHPDVMDATSSHFNIFRVGTTWGQRYEDKRYEMRSNAVRYNFPEFFGFKLLDGKGFTPESAQRKEMIIMHSLHTDVGIPLDYTDINGYKVIGITADMYLNNVGQQCAHSVFFCDEKFGHYNFYARLRAGADVEVFSKYVQTMMKEMFPSSEETEVYFLNEYVEGLYKETKKVTILIGMFGLVSIVIALMGVFGIVMFETQHRKREIAIRKVYGATSRQIVTMLNRQYMWIILCCFVVAAPVAWYICDRWLQQFANRIAMPWWLFALVLLIIMVATLSLVTLRSWKASHENPADVVKR
ncbi:MAG: ABC transporter permease [Bacteroidales bacterium]|nr:ABC transporter permease [Bacteroidales bacterium]